MSVRDAAEGHLYGVHTRFMASEVSSLDAVISSWRSKNNRRASSTAVTSAGPDTCDRGGLAKERVAALASATTTHFQQRATVSNFLHLQSG